METEQLQEIVIDALEERKAQDIQIIDVRNKSSVTDIMVIASGTSTRHVKSLADNVIDRVKANGLRPMGIEGEQVGEWVLVDIGDIVVHLMLPSVRDFYGLERLWSVEATGGGTSEALLTRTRRRT